MQKLTSTVLLKHKRKTIFTATVKRCDNEIDAFKPVFKELSRRLNPTLIVPASIHAKGSTIKDILKTDKRIRGWGQGWGAQWMIGFFGYDSYGLKYGTEAQKFSHMCDYVAAAPRHMSAKSWDSETTVVRKQTMNGFTVLAGNGTEALSNVNGIMAISAKEKQKKGCNIWEFNITDYNIHVSVHHKTPDKNQRFEFSGNKISAQRANVSIKIDGDPFEWSYPRYKFEWDIRMEEEQTKSLNIFDMFEAAGMLSRRIRQICSASIMVGRTCNSAIQTAEHCNYAIKVTNTAEQKEAIL